MYEFTMKHFLIFVALCLITLYANAQEPQKGGRAQSHFSEEGLQIYAFLIDDPEFLERWNDPETPRIKSVSVFQRGDVAIPIIVVATDGSDENGHADLSYDITVTRPTGEVYGHFEDLALWRDKPAPALHLVEQPILIYLEEIDEVGLYTVAFTVHDRIKKMDVEMDLAFVVEE